MCQIVSHLTEKIKGVVFIVTGLELVMKIPLIQNTKFNILRHREILAKTI